MKPQLGRSRRKGRAARRFPALAVALSLCLGALSASSASAAVPTRPFLETFGPTAQPFFTQSTGLAFDGENGDLLGVDRHGENEQQKLAIEAASNLGGTYKLSFEGQSTGWEGEATLAGGESGSGDIAVPPTAAEGMGDLTRLVRQIASGPHTLTAGSTEVRNVPEPASFTVGENIYADGGLIPDGATIVAVSVSQHTVTVSLPVTESLQSAFLTSGSRTVSNVVTESGAFAVGQAIKGEGILPGTTITSVNEAEHKLTLSQGIISASASGVSLSAVSAQVTNVSGGPFTVGYAIEGAGIPANTRVVAVNEALHELTLSQPPTTAGIGVSLTAGSTTLTGMHTASGAPSEGEVLSGTGVQPATTILAINQATGTLFLSKPPSAAGTVSGLKANLPADASGGVIGMALEKLASIGAGNVGVQSGETTANTVTREITFLLALRNFAREAIACDGSGLTGASPSCAVIETVVGHPSGIFRYHEDGTPAAFSALGTNVIDGQNGPHGRPCGEEAASCDKTPQGTLENGSEQVEGQIAVDESGTATDGDIYIAVPEQKLVDIFASDGHYLGQLTKYKQGAEEKLFGEPAGIAVDQAGNLYVADPSKNLIHKYTAQGGAHNPLTNADSVANLPDSFFVDQLAAGAGPTAGYVFANSFDGVWKINATSGALAYKIGGDANLKVAINPADGHLFVSRFNENLVNEYDASGAGSATLISQVVLPSTAGGLAVNPASDDLFVSGDHQIETYGPVHRPAAFTKAVSNLSGASATLNGAVNPNGRALESCSFQYASDAGFNANFANEKQAVTVSGASGGAFTLGFGAATTASIPFNASPATVQSVLQGLSTIGSGNVSVSASNAGGGTTPGGPFTVEFKGALAHTDLAQLIVTSSLTPGGATASVSTTANGGDGWAGSTSEPCAESVGEIGSGTEPVAVHLDLSGLVPGTTYHYRLLATNEVGASEGSDLNFHTPRPPAIAEESVQSVTGDAATLRAEINPEGLATAYRVEYGTSEAYGQSTQVRTLGATDTSPHSVSISLEGLAPGTTYHWRVVADNTDPAFPGSGSEAGEDRELTTFAIFSPETNCPNQAFRGGFSAPLPDCRAYELVSPLDKEGGDIINQDDGTGYPDAMTQSAVSGDKLAYGAYRAFGDAKASPRAAQYVAARSEEGWKSHYMLGPRGSLNVPFLQSVPAELRGLSPDLCQAWIKTYAEPQLAPGAVEGTANLYRRADDAEGCGGESWEALTTSAPPHGTFGLEFEFEGAAADGSAAIYLAEDNLPTEGIQPPELNGQGFALYYQQEGEGKPHFVCVLPNGSPLSEGCQAGVGSSGPQGGIGRNAQLTGAISDDGQRVFWSTNAARNASSGRIYLRENPGQPQSAAGCEAAKACTLAVSKQGEEQRGTNSSQFWAAAGDGSKALYSTGATLYLYDVEADTTTAISGEALGVAGESKDLSRIYFGSKEELSTEPNSEGDLPEAGKPNLYLYEEGQGFRFVSRLSQLESDPAFPLGTLTASPVLHTARATPDGLHLAFMSNISLTGYDNTDAKSGEADTEVFLYDATAGEGEGKLVCASCNPSGARPAGQQTTAKAQSVWTAAKMQVWKSNLYAGGVMSDDGSRLFFESSDALTPRDTNGSADVYEWEAPGSGRCSESSPAYSARDEGCLSLISSGQSRGDAELIDVSPTGRDVFFTTAASLLAQDYGLIDIYDARAEGGLPEPPSPAAQCEGEACQSPAEAPNDPTPASSSFEGSGNVVEKPARKKHRRHKHKHRRHRAARADRRSHR